MRFSQAALVLSCALFAFGTSLSTTQAQSPEWEQRISDLEEELAVLRGRVNRQESDRFDTRFGNGLDGAWYGGGGVYYIRPFWETNPAFQSIQFLGFGDDVAGKTENFDYNNQFAPLVWMGYVGESGFGGRARFWTLSDSETKFAENPGPDPDFLVVSAAPLGIAIFAPLEGDVLKARSELGVTVVDLEATQMVRRRHWTFQGTCGARYARLRQTYSAALIGIDGITEFVQSRHDFEGAGPTGSFEARRHVGDSGLSLYGTLRGAILFGEFEQTVRGVWAPVDATAHLTNGNLDVMPVAETEIGLQLSRDLGGIRLVLDAGVVAQAWFGAGNSSNSDMPGPGIGLFGVSEVSDNSGNLGFFGGKFSAGIEY